MSPKCRSCHAEILWARSESSGKALPLDAEPVENGNIVIVYGPGEPIARYLRKDRIEPADERRRYLSHFATCPQATEHRKNRS